MALRIFRVYASTLDTSDPERVVTTNHNRYRQHWFTMRVRAATAAEAWGHAKRMIWAGNRTESGVCEFWRVNIRNELERLRSSEQAGAT